MQCAHLPVPDSRPAGSVQLYPKGEGISMPAGWNGNHEPHWDEVLDDPVIQIVIERAGLRRATFLTLMTEMRERVRVARAGTQARQPLGALGTPGAT